LIATKKDGQYIGSARSIDSFNIIEAINSQSKLLSRFGGHAQAAGFTVDPQNIENFRDNLLDLADQSLDVDNTKKVLHIEMELKPEDVTWESFHEIQLFAPFGFRNQKPKFIIRNAIIQYPQKIGSDRSHLRFSIVNERSGELIKAIAFGMGDVYSDIINAEKIDLVFTIDVNEWNGSRSLQLNVKDLKISKS
jgi:single-stranded-DNA-specific exonuclease